MKVSYIQFGTGELLFRLDVGMGIPRVNDRVVWEEDLKQDVVYRVQNVFWYKDPNNERVTVSLKKE